MIRIEIHGVNFFGACGLKRSIPKALKKYEFVAVSCHRTRSVCVNGKSTGIFLRVYYTENVLLSADTLKVLLREIFTGTIDMVLVHRRSIQVGAVALRQQTRPRFNLGLE